NHFRLFRLIRDVLIGIKRMFSHAPDTAKEQATLMENVAKHRSIPFHSPEYELARRFFRENLEDILRRAKEPGAKVLVSTLVCNLKDQPPFIAKFSPDTPVHARQVWRDQVSLGEAALARGDANPAILAFGRAITLDSNHALAYFDLGKAWQVAGEPDSARWAYRAAADRDELRFRASSEWNPLIQEEAQKEGAGTVPMERAFERTSPQGLIGRELIFEHLHPNFSGYCLMAQTFLEALRQAGIPVPSEEWPELRPLTAQQWMRLGHVTPVDLALGEWRIRKLTSRWPFVPEPDYSRLVPHTWRDSLALAYIQHEIPWSEVHYRAASHWEEAGQPDSAIAEYGAIAAVRPDAYYPPFRIGVLYLDKKEPQKARPYLEQARKLNSRSPAVAYWLGTCYLLLKRPDAAEVLQAALKLDQQKGTLKPQERMKLRYALSLALIQAGRPREAVPHLRWIADHFPQFSPVRALLERIKRGERVKIEFED
ncbi:MAG TPA: tetratricopeptide repeat protein, partial [Bacteroidetes bacterium]|nr:tetratricopeptide repeat protein [Bacteroidota bacterium]